MTENKKNELAITKIALFEGKKIRKVFHKDEWWFSVVRENRTVENADS